MHEFLSVNDNDSLAVRFEILGEHSGNAAKNKLYGCVYYHKHPLDRGGCGVIAVNGQVRRVYNRIFIRERK